MIGFPKFVEQSSYEASIGMPRWSTGKGPDGLFVKEVRLWNQQLAAERISSMRYRQIDPTLVPEGTLSSYYRLASGSYNADNFATLVQNYNFTDSDTNLSDFDLVPEFSYQDIFEYDINVGDVVARRGEIYHTVCPLYTYYSKGKCYKEPVNELKMTVFPAWSEEDQKLNWELSTVHSSLIDQTLLGSLQESWRSADPIVSSDLQDVNQEPFKKLVSADLLRQEATYPIQATLENYERTFYIDEKINFVPSKCKWFEVLGSDAKSSFREIEISPGVTDITFQLQLKNNPSLDCKDFTFYDAFDSLEFDFILHDTAEYIQKKPELRYALHNPSLQGAAVDPTLSDLQLNVTIPASQQGRLPVFKNVGILMKVRWTNSKFASELHN